MFNLGTISEMQDLVDCWEGVANTTGGAIDPQLTHRKAGGVWCILIGKIVTTIFILGKHPMTRMKALYKCSPPDFELFTHCSAQK